MRRASYNEICALAATAGARIEEEEEGTWSPCDAEDMNRDRAYRVRVGEDGVEYTPRKRKKDKDKPRDPASETARVIGELRIMVQELGTLVVSSHKRLEDVSAKHAALLENNIELAARLCNTIKDLGTAGHKSGLREALEFMTDRYQPQIGQLMSAGAIALSALGGLVPQTDPEPDATKDPPRQPERGPVDVAFEDS